MKRIYLFCSAGMSTGILVGKMQDVANSHDLPTGVRAFPDGKIGQVINGKYPDVILLGPQVKYHCGKIVEKYDDKGIPIRVTDQTDYGMMSGKKVLKSATKLMKAAK